MKKRNKDASSKPAMDPVAWRQRTATLSIGVQRMVEQAAGCIDRRQFIDARRAMVGALALAPGHPEVLRLHGLLSHLEGQHEEAIAILRSALEGSPNDALLLTNLGSALRASGDLDGAIGTFRRATESAPTLAAAWFNLGKALKAQALMDEAGLALAQAVRLAPGHAAARLALGDARKALGDTAGAADCYRQVTRLDPGSAQAWFSLANLKTLRFDAAETATIARLLDTPGISEEGRIALGFAQAKAFEDAGLYEQAFACLVDANARKRRQVRWNPEVFSARVDAILAAFPRLAPVAPDDRRGREVIFVVSLPRSGSTLAEQILAAHPDVEGASELPDLPAILEDESKRRGKDFPRWVGEATAEDWQRLGNQYLARTQRWRVDRPRFTDKGLPNWQYVGAALAMLPAARVVICRRDALETCISCFHQLFARGQEYSYDLAELAAYWRDFDRLCQHWAAQDPVRVRALVYEDLLGDPGREIPRLLDFCGLSQHEACLRPHESTRTIRTASAAQVRQPMRRDTARADRYGAALAPLREALLPR